MNVSRENHGKFNKGVFNMDQNLVLRRFVTIDPDKNLLLQARKIG